VVIDDGDGHVPVVLARFDGGSGTDLLGRLQIDRRAIGRALLRDGAGGQQREASYGKTSNKRRIDFITAPGSGCGSANDRRHGPRRHPREPLAAQKPGTLAGRVQPRCAMPTPLPLAVVQAQLDAYNAQDIDALLATYAPDAELNALHGERLAKGHDEMRPRFLARFKEPDLHAQLLSRTSMGSFVIDHERVTRNFPEGRGSVEMLCVYEVRDGLIQKASFSVGAQTLDAA
jgi:hypothetical protein